MEGENEVVVVALDKRYKKLEKDLTSKTGKILLELRASKLTTSGLGLEIYLVGSATMRKLNRQYRGKDAVTNVLAFGSPTGFPRPLGAPPDSLGEVYLCLPYIKKRREDIQSLLAHGMLHLMGFNHVSVGDRMTMEKTEEKLLAWLNP